MAHVCCNGSRGPVLLSAAAHIIGATPITWTIGIDPLTETFGNFADFA